MPGFVTASVLLVLIAASAAAGAALLAVTAAGQALRSARARRRARLDGRVRRLVLGTVSSKRVPLEAVRSRGRYGGAVERVTLSYLAQLRGQAHSLLAEILERRGTAASAIRASCGRRAHARARAAGLLGVIASSDAQWRLEQMAEHDPSRVVRVVAVRALGESGAPGAAATLVRLLGGHHAAAVSEGVVSSALLALGPVAIPALRHAATAPGPPARRAAAIDLLGLLKDLTAWEIVAGHLNSPDSSVRLSAVRALGQLGVRQAAEALAATLTAGEEPGVRAAAAWALGRIRDQRGAAALKRSLSDGDHLVAHNAAQALAQLRAPGQLILTEVADGDDTAAGHAREALALGIQASGIRPPASLPPVLSRPESPRPISSRERTGR
jgi:HEAT repeat protein